MIINDNNKNDTNGFEEAEGERERETGDNEEEEGKKTPLFSHFFLTNAHINFSPSLSHTLSKMEKKGPR
jgi:hypothetical protein